MNIVLLNSLTGRNNSTEAQPIYNAEGFPVNFYFSCPKKSFSKIFFSTKKIIYKKKKGIKIE